MALRRPPAPHSDQVMLASPCQTSITHAMAALQQFGTQVCGPTNVEATPAAMQVLHSGAIKFDILIYQ